MATILSDLGQVEKALSVLEKFIATNSENVECRQVQALIQLRAGQLEEGFKNYDWRLMPGQNSVAIRPFAQARWMGNAIDSKKLLVWLEQGIGDEILSLNMMSDICERVQNCIIECDERLVPLIRRSYPGVAVAARTDPPDSQTRNADLVCPVWSTAQFLRREWSDFPKHKGYLKPDEETILSVRQRYKSIAQDRKLIGLSWASGVKGGQFKTPPLDCWSPLFDWDDILFVSLQYAPATADIENLNSLGRGEIHVDPDIDTTLDLDLSAAQIAALDGVVSISNSTAHMAGAIGIPIACLVPEGHGGFWY